MPGRPFVPAKSPLQTAQLPTGPKQRALSPLGLLSVESTGIFCERDARAKAESVAAASVEVDRHHHGLHVARGRVALSTAITRSARLAYIYNDTLIGNMNPGNYVFSAMLYTVSRKRNGQTRHNICTLYFVDPAFGCYTSINMCVQPYCLQKVIQIGC